MLEALENTWPSCSSHLKKSFVLLMYHQRLPTRVVATAAASCGRNFAWLGQLLLEKRGNIGKKTTQVRFMTPAIHQAC